MTEDEKFRKIFYGLMKIVILHEVDKAVKRKITDPCNQRGNCKKYRYFDKYYIDTTAEWPKLYNKIDEEK